MSFNERQRRLLNILFDGFFGKLTTRKWTKIVKCSTDIALNDIRGLVEKGVLRKNEEGGRNTNYILTSMNPHSTVETTKRHGNAPRNAILALSESVGFYVSAEYLRIANVLIKKM